MARLYKYYSIDDDVKFQRILDLLETNEIYLSDGKDFNDPFDIRVTSRKNKKLNFVKKFRVLCLTSSYRNKLMWSHYADAHQGICITIETLTDLIYPVFYTRERVYDDTNLDLLLSKHNKRSVIKKFVKPYDMISKKKLGYVKDSTWVYENEYRIVFYDKEIKDLIDGERLKVKISKVYLGNRIAFEKENKIKKICALKHIDVSKISFTDDGYAIRVN